ncbi:MAG: DUF2380 domain-containing protein [Methylococcales bacterium]
MNIKKTCWKKVFSLILLSCISYNLTAETKIAILEFELKDMTLVPRIPAEIKRTASIKPLLEAELKTANYTIIDIDLKSQKFADSGVGYLFDHHDVAAKLAKGFGADYVLVGRLHKPSFLFSYLMGHLIRVSDAKLIGNYISEAKGPNIKLTVKTVESLTVKIDRTLDNRYTPPPPAKKSKP